MVDQEDILHPLQNPSSGYTSGRVQGSTDDRYENDVKTTSVRPQVRLAMQFGRSRIMNREPMNVRLKKRASSAVTEHAKASSLSFVTVMVGVDVQYVSVAISHRSTLSA